MARLATQVMLGRRLRDLGVAAAGVPHFGVKEAVFPFPMFPEVDPVLGPEMRSTGEVLGLADSFGLAFFKSQEAAGQRLPTQGTVLVTVADKDKPGVVEVARQFRALGFALRATAGTHAVLAAHGVPAEPILKLHEGQPNILDAVRDGRIQLVVNTPIGRRSQVDDSYIRKAAIRHRVPYITTLAAAHAAAKGIAAFQQGSAGPWSLQEYHSRLR
jgi:carbamoyl-phosphate synthase large subunit